MISCQTVMVISNKSSQAFLGLLMALLILGTTNHCIIEDLFASCSEVIFGTGELQQLPNQLGSHVPDEHSDSPEPHEHGQPHPVIAIRFEKAAVDFLKLILVITSFCCWMVYPLGTAVVGRATEVVSLATIGEPPGSIGSFIASLTQAPQAPPIF